MNEQALRFRIGVFVLASLLLLALLITLFGSFPRLLTPGTEYTVRFAEAPGLAPGTPVRRSGVRVGEVTSVRLDDETGDVRAVLRVDRPYTVRRNEVPTLVQALLGGDAAIDFVPRRGEAEPDRRPYPPGAELAGARQANVAGLLNQAADVLPTTQETLNEIRKSIQRFERLAEPLEQAVKQYQALGEETRKLVREVSGTNEQVKKLAAAANDIAPRVGKAADAVGQLAEATQKTLPELQETNKTVRGAAGRVGDLAEEVRKGIPDLKKTNDEAQAALVTWQRVGERAKLLIETNEKQFGEALQRVNNTFSEDNQRNFGLILRNVRDGTENLKTLSRSTEELVKESQKTVRRVGESVGKADGVLSNLEQATKPLAERGASVMKNLDESTGRLNEVLGDVQALFRNLDKTDGTLKRFLTDPSLFNRLDEIACSVQRFVPRVDRLLRDVEVFADKIARHPESLGVGGAVRPSAGLKESPSAPVTSWGRPGGPR